MSILFYAAARCAEAGKYSNLAGGGGFEPPITVSKTVALGHLC